VTRLRHKLLAAFVVINLLALTAFGLFAYRSAMEVAAAREARLLVATVRERARHLSATLPSLPSVERWRQALSRYHSDDYASVVGNAHGMVAASRPLTKFLGPRHLDFPFATLFTDAAGHGTIEFAGHRYVWAATAVPGTDQTLLHLYRAWQPSVAPLATLPGRLAVAAAIILWIAAWLALLFASTVSRRLESRTAQLLHQTLHDGLTGLPNRQQLEQRTDEALRDAGGPPNLAVLMIDLNGFKEIDDTLGRPLGDRLLRAVGERLQQTVAGPLCLARVGGDEFGLLLEGDADRALVAVEQVRGAMERPFILDRHPLQLTADVGIALAPDHGEEADTLLRHAQLALFQARQAGDSHTFFSHAEPDHGSARLALGEALREALETETLTLEFRPRRRLADNTLAGLEATVRWTPPEAEPMDGDAIAALANHTGAGRPLTAWTLKQALLHCARFARHDHPLEMAVRLTARDLHDGELPALVDDTLKRFAVPPEWLTLEVTEATLAADPRRNGETLRQLGALGVNLAIHEFGTGHTCLAELQRLPISEIRIDRRFVAAMTRDPDSAAVVRGAVSLGRSLGLKVVATGVADKETAERLAGLGCETGQGAHLGAPQAPEALLASLGR